MKIINVSTLILLISILTGCAITAEQKAKREAQQIKKAQQQQIQLAKQCDPETADLIAQKFELPLNTTPVQQAQFEQRYTQKVNHPLFQACYKLALAHHNAQEELNYLRSFYDNARFGFSPFCYSCW